MCKIHTHFQAKMAQKSHCLGQNNINNSLHKGVLSREVALLSIMLCGLCMTVNKHS